MLFRSPNLFNFGGVEATAVDMLGNLAVISLSGHPREPEDGGEVAPPPRSVMMIANIASPSSPSLFDAVSLLPGQFANDVAMEGNVVVITTEEEQVWVNSVKRVNVPEGLEVVVLPITNVVSVEPEYGTRGVPVDTEVTVVFSEPVETATVTGTSFKLCEVSGAAGGIGAEVASSITALDERVVERGDEPEIEYVNGTKTFRLTPTSPLDTNTDYVVVLTNAIVSAATEYPLITPFQSTFTTSLSTDPDDSQTPAIDSVEPHWGLTEGGTTIIVHGSLFADGAQVLVGGEPATGELIENGGTRITATVPAQNSQGAAAVEVRNPGGANAVIYGAFVYIDPMEIDEVIPNKGPVEGGTEVVIYGTGFLPDRKSVG